MLKFLIVFIVLSIGCNSKSEIKYSKDDLVSFCNVYKDSVFVESYKFKTQKKQPYNYYYYNNNDQGFIFKYDSLNNALSKINIKKGDTSALEFEEKKYYIENDKIFIVSEFIEDKDVTDGAVSYYFNPKFGLLAQRSKTWQISKFILFSQSDSNYVLGQALIYNILVGIPNY
jgi:hypothetical protein